MALPVNFWAWAMWKTSTVEFMARVSVLAQQKPWALTFSVTVTISKGLPLASKPVSFRVMRRRMRGSQRRSGRSTPVAKASEDCRASKSTGFWK